MAWTSHVRRLTDKVRRRARHLAGRPDNSPWVLTPRSLRGEVQYADFVFALDYQSPSSRMLRLFHEAMSAHGLSTLLVNKANVRAVTDAVQAGWFKPHLFLDLCALTGDPFYKLLYAAADAGIHTICDPHKDFSWSRKASAHPRLEAAGLPLPPTVILKADEPDRELTEEERACVGDYCVVKPSGGGAGRGVKLRVNPTGPTVAKLRDFDRKDDWLIQKMLKFSQCGDRPAYIRGYNIFGHRSLLWWSVERRGYDALTWADVRKYDLLPVLDLLDRIAALNGMEFFSTEIAAVADSGPDRWVIIDYTNDQCDIDPDGSPSGNVPLPWLLCAYRRFAEVTWRLKHGLPAQQDRMVYLMSEEDARASARPAPPATPAAAPSPVAPEPMRAAS